MIWLKSIAGLKSGSGIARVAGEQSGMEINDVDRYGAALALHLFDWFAEVGIDDFETACAVANRAATFLWYVERHRDAEEMEEIVGAADGVKGVTLYAVAGENRFTISLDAEEINEWRGALQRNDVAELNAAANRFIRKLADAAGVPVDQIDANHDDVLNQVRMMLEEVDKGG